MCESNQSRHSRTNGVAALLLSSVLLLGWLTNPVSAQFGGGGFGGGGGGFGGGGGGFGGGQGGQGQGQGNFNAAGGIIIDADGVVSSPLGKVISSDVAKKRMAELANQFLSGDITRPSSLRKVSLPRLERACAEYFDKKEPVPEEMQYFAGLQRIDFVFVFPETNDVVIAGPAEPFAPDPTGRAVGLKSGRPVLRLDDFVVALRTTAKTAQWGCSIDPVAERLAELQQYVKSHSNPVGINAAQQRFQKMQKILGNHDVKVWGVPDDTHFAHTLIEADYHMKLIAIGLLDPRVPGLKSHLALAQPGGNSMERWWFAPLYEPFRTSGDGLAFEFSGPRCQLMSQDEQIDAAGKKSDAPFTKQSTVAFGKSVTDKFAELASRLPVFAELQNLFDLAVLTALMRREELPKKANWQPSLFLDDAKAPVLRGPTPKHTKTLLNTKSANKGLVIGLLNGGVVIDSQKIVEQTSMSTQSAAEVSARRMKNAPASDLDAKRWWWD